MKHFKGIIVLFLMICIALAIAASLFALAADARADFEKWSNRSARVVEPADYKTNGTCCEAICTWKGVRGVGNVGIGNGSISLMEPDVINEMAANSMQATGSNTSSNETVGKATNGTAGKVTNETSDKATNASAGKTANGTASKGNTTADSVIHAPANNSSGNGTLVSRNADNQIALPEEAANGPVTESLLPDYDLAASIIPRGVPYTVTVNTPFAHILAEDPVEASVLYGKLTGFTMPCGQVVDVGIKCLGYEY
jgi:hypothetical protein